jgi:gamma-glutamyltranspeptidase/glutathione hydrolase
VQALNGSGRSPKALSIDVARKNGAIGKQLTERDLNSVTVPGAAAAWIDTVASLGNGKVTFGEVMAPAIRLAEEGCAASSQKIYSYWANRVLTVPQYPNLPPIA